MRANRLPKITKIITKMEFLRITQPSHEKTFDNSRTSSTVPNRIKSSTLCCIIPTSSTCDTSPLHICGTTLLLFVAVGSRNCAEKISTILSFLKLHYVERLLPYSHQETSPPISPRVSLPFHGHGKFPRGISTTLHQWLTREWTTLYNSTATNKP